ncbi:MAG: hypothetical protein LBG31_00925 [Prevotellaceae bacterium]|jgi:hypothetical protein|nr:hypothetical protein [Prevotellaceae bacterium]
MNKMRIKIILFTFFIMAAQAGFAQEPLFSTSLSRDSIMIGEQVEWSFKATMPSSVQVYFARVDSIGNGLIEVLKTTGPDTLQRTKDNITIESKLLLTSFDAGIYELPQIPALVTHSNNNLVDTLYFNSVTLKVNTLPDSLIIAFLSADDSTKVKLLKDIKPPVKYPYTLMEILWPWATMGIIALALVAGLIYVIIRLRKKQPVFGKIKPAEPPHIVALRELEKIKAEKLWQNNKVKLYYTRVTDVLRVYLEKRYAIQAPEQTSDEILQALAQLPLPEYFIPKLREFLSTSDLVKFAKYLPAMEENESALTLVTQFVDETKEQTEKEATD